MIDIQDGGLYPISDFILEENFKQRYNDTHMDFQHQEQLEEPYYRNNESIRPQK